MENALSGWTWSDYAGVAGGYELDLGEIVLVVAQHPATGEWEGFAIRFSDGATLYHRVLNDRNDAARSLLTDPRVAEVRADQQEAEDWIWNRNGEN